jgi:hypothetical protein
MAHLFLERARLHDLTKDRADLRAQFRWETINAVAYKTGGIIFILGSIFFFPALERYANIGAWSFFIGSLFYLIVTVHDLAEVRHNWKTEVRHSFFLILEFVAAVSYVCGTILFTVGSALFMSAIEMYTAGAWCFVIGSLLFVVGAVVNVLQIVKASSVVTLQLMNFTAITFVVGSVLFTVASVPYLWNVDASPFHLILYDFLAWQYLTGSMLFFLGGVFNFWRAYLVMRGQIANQNQGKE